MNTPDYWQLLKLTHDGETIYKVFATWVGGYTTGDAWKINSGIVKVIEGDGFYDLIGHSGSIYRVSNHENVYRTNSYSGGILNNLIESAKKVNGVIEIIPFQEVEQTLKNIEYNERV